MSVIRYSFLALILLATASPAIAQKSKPSTAKTTGKIYCWDTPQGRQCGDTLPADQAGARRDELSSRTGNVLKQVDRTKTAEELAIEEQAQEQARAAQDAAIRQDRDRASLKMRYESVSAITEEYAVRRQALEVSLGLAETSEKSAHRSLVAALDGLAGVELSGKKVTDGAFKKVADLHKLWSKQLDSVRSARSRIVEIDAERDQQIELWSSPESGTDHAVPQESTPSVP